MHDSKRHDSIRSLHRQRRIFDPHFYAAISPATKNIVLPYTGTKKMSVVFAPETSVTYHAFVQLFNDMVTKPDTLYLIGSGGGGPNLQTDSSALNFGTVVCGTHVTDSIRLYNSGNATLFISCITTALHSVFQPSPTTLAITAGDSVSIAVEFSPAASSVYNDTLTLASNAITSPDKIPLSGTGSTTDVEELKPLSSLSLDQNYPNPFQQTTTIRFTIPAAEQAELYVLDMLGRHIATIASGFFIAGSHGVSFNGSRLPTGVYTCVFQAGTTRIVRTIVHVQ